MELMTLSPWTFQSIQQSFITKKVWRKENPTHRTDINVVICVFRKCFLYLQFPLHITIFFVGTLLLSNKPGSMETCLTTTWFICCIHSVVLLHSNIKTPNKKILLCIHTDKATSNKVKDTFNKNRTSAYPVPIKQYIHTIGPDNWKARSYFVSANSFLNINTNLKTLGYMLAKS